MKKEMERGDGGKVGETESQRAAWREDVGETKRRLERNRCWQRDEDEREGNKGEVERESENRKMKNLTGRNTEGTKFACVCESVCVVRAVAFR